MFDSPFDHCPVCGEVVLLDQTLTECAREHQCQDTNACPLKNVFCGHDFSHPDATKSAPASGGTS